jgi:thiol-disulfide isomerase/thioredoxin
MNLKTIAALASALLLTSFSSAEHPKSGGEHPSASAEKKAPVLAVVFHADGCPSCKALAPRLAAVEPDVTASVEFVRLDLTNDATRKVAEQTAGKHGLAGLYQANAGKTGVVALVDRKSGKTLQEISSAMDTDAIRAAMMAAAAGSSGSAQPKKEHPSSEHPKPAAPKSEHPSSEHPN